MKEYLIPHFDISVVVNEDGSGKITSNLKKMVCEASCPSEGDLAAVDAIEAFILALACEGYDVSEQRFAAALRTSLDAIANNY